MYVRDQERQKLKDLRERLDKHKQHLAELEKHVYVSLL
jgi:hypothetical protein